MLAKIYSAAVYGVDAYEVEIEVNGAGAITATSPASARKKVRHRSANALAERVRNSRNDLRPTPEPTAKRA
jgi:hypothetical protein